MLKIVAVSKPEANTAALTVTVAEAKRNGKVLGDLPLDAATLRRLLRQAEAKAPAS